MRKNNHTEALQSKKTLFLILILTSILCVNLISAFTGGQPEFEFRFENNLTESFQTSIWNNYSSRHYATGKVNDALIVNITIAGSSANIINDSTNGEYADAFENWTVMFWIKPDTEWNAATSVVNIFQDGDGANGWIWYDSNQDDGDISMGTGGSGSQLSYDVDIPATWHHIIGQFQDGGSGNSLLLLWYDGENVANHSETYAIVPGVTMNMFQNAPEAGCVTQCLFDEFKYFNYTMNASTIAEIYDLESTGSHYLSDFFPVASSTTTLIAPANDTDLTTIGINFSASYTAVSSNLTNITYYIWDSDKAVFNNSVYLNINGTSNSTSMFIDNFVLGDFEWNVLTCFANDTFADCGWADNNFTFSAGATVHDTNYTFSVFETSSQTFTANITILTGSEISLAQLIYNGTYYEVSNISIVGDNLFLTRTIDIPLNPFAFQNTTNNVFFSFTYTDVNSTNQNTTSTTQNVSFINLQLCNSTYNTQAINFSLKDELTGILIDASANSTNVEATFNYWLGEGTTFRNFSFSRLANATANAHEICIFPNQTYKVDMDMVYSAADFDARTYVLRNASVTNVTSEIDLFLLFENFATKFTIEVRQGITNLQNAVVTVAKFFTGEGVHKTISIRETDNAGEFVEYLDLDNDYRYSIVLDGVLLGIIDKQATCTEAPCEFTLQIEEIAGNLYAGLTEHFASGVFSNLSFDINTKIVTYEFIDTTGLAQYFRLRVTQGAYNGTGVEICNQQVFSSSGSMTCNVTGFEGNFVAVGTLSRSPELTDKILEFTLDLLRDSLGLMAILISFGIIITITMAGAVLSGGNPSVVLGAFGLSLLGTKLMTLLPFSWILVTLIELVILVIMGWLKT